jgi:hypothetical protein
MQRFNVLVSKRIILVFVTGMNLNPGLADLAIY